MIDFTRAVQLAESSTVDGLTIDPASMRELTEGWFFGYSAAEQYGSHGIIINKSSGKAFELGSAFPLERDLAMYDRGYQFDRYDLVILAVVDVARTLETLLQIGPTVIEPQYENGTVWRVPRPLSRDEIEFRISRLPCVFGNLSLYFRLETLEEAREQAYFEFRALSCPG